MIRTDLQSLLQEIRDAKKRLDPHLKKRQELIQHTAGRHYRNSEGFKQATPENLGYCYKSFVKPQLLFGRPAARVQAGSPIYAETADALELACNYWAKEINFKAVADEVLDDAFVGFGLTLTGVCPDPSFHGQGLGAVYDNFEQVPNYPFCIRVDPRCAILDARAKSLDECRIIGHTYEQDHEDVTLDQRNDPEAAASTKPSGDERTDAGGRDTAAFANEGNREGERRRITIHEVYLPEHKLLVAIAELGDGAAAGVILRQEEFFGPDEGPFTLWGLDTVAGELVPLSPLVALWDSYLEVNAHAKAAARSAETHKKLGIFQPSAKEDADRIQRASSGDMVPVKDPASVRDFEIGGASVQQIQYLDVRTQRLEKAIGFGGAQQGVAGKQTATGESIANQNSDLRIDRMRDRVADSISSVYRKVAWYFFHDSSLGSFDLQAQNEQTGAMEPARLIAGPWDGGMVDGAYVPPEPQSDFTDYQFEIDASSMVKTDDALEQKRAQDEFAMCLQLFQMGMPINWRRVIDRLGDKMGTRDLSSIILLDQAGQVIPLDPYAQGPQMLGQQPGGKPNPASSIQKPPSSGFPRTQGKGMSTMSPSNGLPGMLGAAQRAPMQGAGMLARAG